jgi:hypothetical protein
LVSCFAYSSTLMVEEIRPFEMSINFYIDFISGGVSGSNLDRITGYIEVTVILARRALHRRHEQACRYANLHETFRCNVVCKICLNGPCH